MYEGGKKNDLIEKNLQPEKNVYLNCGSTVWCSLPVLPPAGTGRLRTKNYPQIRLKRDRYECADQRFHQQSLQGKAKEMRLYPLQQRRQTAYKPL